MKIIKINNENLIVINKSKFIGIIKKVYSQEEIDNLLKDVRQKYSDSTHICYAYIIPNKEKYDDDGEPLGTAGIPILDILKKNDLCYVIAIVVRYFGGIKLGSNGLVRAYSNTIANLIKDNTKDIETGYLIKIEEDYNKNDLLDYLLKEANIIKKDYQDKITIEVLVNKKTLDNLSNVNYQIIEERII